MKTQNLLESLLELLRNKDTSSLKELLKLCHDALNRGKYPEYEYEAFVALGDIYLIKNDIYELLKAAALYQYAKKLVEDFEIKDKEQKLKAVDIKIAQIEEKFLKLSKGIEHQYDPSKTKKWQASLQQFRESLKPILDSIENLGIQGDQVNESEIHTRAEIIEEIYTGSGGIREFFIGESSGLIKEMLSESMNLLGLVPYNARYSIIGLGSLALGTMTPWSDFEWAILIDDSLDEDKTSEVKEYFRKLALLMQIYVINIGETILPAMAIKELNDFDSNNKLEDDWFYDNLMPRGFSFDGAMPKACKSPLGRKGYKNHRNFELICSPTEMAKFQQEDWYHEDMELSQSLLSPILINGEQSLLDKYQKVLSEIIDIKQENGFTIRQQRAFKILKEDYEKYKTIFSHNTEGLLFDVKKEIYRFPDRIIVALTDCLGKRSTDNWRAIKSLLLQVNPVLNQVCSDNILSCLSIAVEVRLRTYSHNNGQRENLNIFPNIIPENDENNLLNITNKVFHIKHLGILYIYFETSLPIQYTIKECLSLNELSCRLNNINKYLNYNQMTMGIIHQRMMNYNRAIEYFNEVVLGLPEIENDINRSAVLQVFKCLSNCYVNISQYKKALYYLKLCIEILEKDINKDYSTYISILISTGKIYCNIGKYEKALNYHSKSLEICIDTIGVNDINYFITLNNLSDTYNKIGNYQKALDYAKQALAALEVIPKKNVYYSIVLNNIGEIYRAKGEYTEAINFYRKAIKNIHSFTGNSHTYYASLLNNLAIVYSLAGNYDEAIIYCKYALQVMEVVKKELDTEYAKILINMGGLHKIKGDYDNAIHCSKAALQIQEKLLNRNHPDIALTLNNLGGLYQTKGKYDKSLDYLNKALTIREKTIGRNHQDYAITLNNIGMVYSSTGDYKEALKYFKQALEIFEENTIDKDHANYALLLDNIAGILMNTENYDEALIFYKRALAIREQKLGKDHLDYLTTLNNISVLYSYQEKYDKAIEINKKVLPSIEKINGKNHYYAITLSNVGMLYYEKGDHYEGINYIKQALEIIENILGKHHLDYACLLNNLGEVYNTLKNYNDAINCVEEALGILEQIVGKNHPDYLITSENLSELYSKQQEYKTEMNLIDKVLVKEYGKDNKGAENIEGCSSIMIDESFIPEDKDLAKAIELSLVLSETDNESSENHQYTISQTSKNTKNVGPEK